MEKKLKLKALLVIALTALAIWLVYPPKDKVRLGLDLSGGMYLVLSVDTSALPEKSKADAVDRAVEIIRNRVDQFGVKEPIINKQGINQIVIQLAGVTDRDRALALIGQTALLEFKLVDDKPENIQAAKEGKIPAGYVLKDTEAGQILVEEKAALTGNRLSNAEMDFDSARFGEPYVKIQFDAEGAKIFAQVTQQNVGKRLAIMLDGKVHSAPQIREPIPGGQAQITGTFTREQASDLALVLRAGALPAPIKIEEERTVGPNLGKDFITSGVRASLIGAIGVLVLVAIYYYFAGIVANVALILNFIFLLAGLVLLHASLTLPGIAGIALTLGMAVDANVLIFERIREESDVGKPIKTAISTGYARAFLTIFDSNVTTLISAIILFWFGTGPVRGFATTLTIGLVISMFTAIFVTRIVLDWMCIDKSFQKLRMRRLFTKTNIDFVGKRKIAYAVSLITLAVGLIAFAGRGQTNFGIEFTGGEELQYKFTQKMSTEHLRKVLGEIGLGTVPIQQFGNEKEFIIRTSKDAIDPIQKKFAETFKDQKYELVRIEHIGPAVGKELTEKALWALILSFIGMCIYVAFRFEFKFSIAAILALIHDLFVVIGMLALTGREISLPVIAAILAILGYSINDTIVVFDRIREDMKLMKKMTFPEIVNLSINQTLSRTLLTGVSTAVVVLSLFFLGGKGINDFAFVFVIGQITGTYSSVFVAAPLIVDWPKKKAL